MEHRSKELLRLEHKNSPLSSLESALLLCKNGSTSPTKKPPSDGKPLTAPLPPSQLLGKLKNFLGVMSEANRQLELEAKVNQRNHDIEELTGNESEVIEMDLMLGVADLQTPEAVAAAESAISGFQPVISLGADSGETDFDESSSDDDSEDDEDSDGEDDDNGTKSSSNVKRPNSGKDDITSKQNANHHSKKRPNIVELS